MAQQDLDGKHSENGGKPKGITVSLNGVGRNIKAASEITEELTKDLAIMSKQTDVANEDDFDGKKIKVENGEAKGSPKIENGKDGSRTRRSRVNGDHHEANGQTGEANKVNGSPPDEPERSCFNGDIICKHGKLCTQNSLRRLVSKKVWDRLKYYFPVKAPEFRRDHPSCSECQVRILYSQVFTLANSLVS